jgi:hypothetical protein
MVELTLIYLIEMPSFARLGRWDACPYVASDGSYRPLNCLRLQ